MHILPSCAKSKSLFPKKNERNEVEYNLKDVLLSDLFFSNILEAAKITNMHWHETSFAVNGDVHEYEVNDVLEEDVDKCQAGVDEFGIIYDVEGYGLYMPEQSLLHMPEPKFRILAIHFHPPDNSAVPSINDLISLYNDFRNNYHKTFDRFTRGIGWVNPLEIVGHKKGSKIVLFLLQFTDKFNFDPKTSEDDDRTQHLTISHDDLVKEIIESMYYEVWGKASNQYNELDFADRRLPYKFAEYFNSRGFFRATVLCFNNRKEYEIEIEKTKEYEFFRSQH
jgi:hypothetical protein